MGAHSNTSLIEYITACAKRALRGQTPSVLREYSFSFDEAAKRIVLKAEIERDLTEDEHESLMVAETEIYADSIFGDDTEVETLVEIVPLGSPLHPLPGGIVLRRDDDGVSDALGRPGE